MENEEVVGKAKGMGWVPQEEWNGDPEKWRPAAEFVERGENIIPILKDRLGKLEADLKIATAHNKNEIEHVKQMAYDRAKSEYEAKLSELQRRELEAFKAGDTNEYMAVKQEMVSIKPPEAMTAAVENPVFVEWKEKNPWYTTDKELSDFADFVSNKIVAERGGRDKIADAELAEEMTKRVKTTFAHKFENPKRKEAQPVESGSSAPSSRSQNKAFNDLPDSAQKAYHRQAERFKAQGREFTKEDYLKAYLEA